MLGLHASYMPPYVQLTIITLPDSSVARSARPRRRAPLFSGVPALALR